MTSFKTEYPFKARQEEAGRILQKYPNRVPIIVERASTKSSLPCLTKKKYLVPQTLPARNL